MRVLRPEVHQLKRSIAIEVVIGETVPLTRRGSHLVGKCPFHQDEHPSLIVTPAKPGAYGLFNCPACSVGGDVITWLEKTRGLSFGQAIALLSKEVASYSHSPTPQPDSKPFELTLAHLRWLDVLQGHYRQRLENTPEALEYLRSRGFRRSEVIERFGVGYCDGNLGSVLPAASTEEGAEARRVLREFNLLLPKDRELLAGCIVTPQFDADGRVVSFSARRIGAASTHQRHLSLGHRGIVNRGALAIYSTMIVTESPLDAMSCAEADLWNVTCCYGTNGISAELEAQLVAHAQRVVLWLDGDEAGQRATERFAHKLLKAGVPEVLRVPPIQGIKDANELLINHGVEAFSQIIEHAEFIELPKEPEVSTKSRPPHSQQPPNQQSSEPNQEPSPSPSAQPPPSPLLELTVTSTDEFRFRAETHSFTIAGFERTIQPGAMRVNILVERGGREHQDTCDLFQETPRARFIAAVVEKLELDASLVEKQVDEIRRELRRRQKERFEARAEASKKPVKIQLTDEERADALAFWKSPDLLDQIDRDITSMGLVGEQRNARLAYFAMMSRKTRHPFSLVLLSAPSSGKSTIQKVIARLCPDEEKKSWSAVTGRALNYVGEDELVGKVIFVDELLGAEDAEETLKVLLTEHRSSTATTSKNPTTNRFEVTEYTVRGPFTLLSTSTIDPGAEFATRMLNSPMTMSPEQTKAVHARLRQSRGRLGFEEDEKQDSIIQRHHNAQRARESMPVVIEESELSFAMFPIHRPDMRRLYELYLNLIEAIAFTLGLGRTPVMVGRSRDVAAIPATQEDVDLANALMEPIMRGTLSQLTAAPRRFLDRLEEWLCAKGHDEGLSPFEIAFTHDMVAEALGVGLTTAKGHLRTLTDERWVEMESSARKLVYRLCIPKFQQRAGLTLRPDHRPTHTAEDGHDNPQIVTEPAAPDLDPSTPEATSGPVSDAPQTPISHPSVAYKSDSEEPADAPEKDIHFRILTPVEVSESTPPHETVKAEPLVTDSGFPPKFPTQPVVLDELPLIPIDTEPVSLLAPLEDLHMSMRGESSDMTRIDPALPDYPSRPDVTPWVQPGVFSGSSEHGHE